PSASFATSPTAFYTLSLHDALPIFFAARLDKLPVADLEAPGQIQLAGKIDREQHAVRVESHGDHAALLALIERGDVALRHVGDRSEEHTSELQSRFDLVCRLPLEKT